MQLMQHAYLPLLRSRSARSGAQGVPSMPIGSARKSLLITSDKRLKHSMAFLCIATLLLLRHGGLFAAVGHTPTMPILI